jgi:hypothetical protein
MGMGIEEKEENKKLFGLLQGFVYLTIVLEIIVYLYGSADFWGYSKSLIWKFRKFLIYQDIVYSKLFTLFIILLVSVGAKSRKDLHLNAKRQIIIPLAAGFFFFFGSIIFYVYNFVPLDKWITLSDVLYIAFSFVGAVLIHMSLDNVSKRIKSNLGKDKWNVENESFPQNQELIDTPTSVNLPTLYYYKGKVHKGIINMNPFYGTIIIGTPGSGKSFSIIIPIIKQLLSKKFPMVIYDFKYPDLGEIAYYHYLKLRASGELKGYKFHVINLNDVEKSKRINPLKASYINKLSDAAETAQSLVESLKKGDKASGADQFFTQSAINFLTSAIYFFAKYQNGKYSTLPHVLAFMNLSYQVIFDCLFTEIELSSLLSPFRSAYENKAFDQLEGQIGTLKINLSRLATKETFWVFGDDDFDLKISNPKDPSILVLANHTSTQDINSACYAVVMNRLTRLLNDKGNLPSGIIVDETPTLYMHKVENLIATARSNKVGVVMGLQELPQFRQLYGKETSETITSVVGNILSGSAREKHTLEWLQTIFGKSKQISESVSFDGARSSVSLQERDDYVIPASKIASLGEGEFVGTIRKAGKDDWDGKFTTSAINCKINLDTKQIAQESKYYQTIPNFYNFGDYARKEAILKKNFLKIIEEVAQVATTIRSQPTKV